MWKKYLLSFFKKAPQRVVCLPQCFYSMHIVRDVEKNLFQQSSIWLLIRWNSHPKSQNCMQEACWSLARNPYNLFGGWKKIRVDGRIWRTWSHIGTEHFCRLRSAIGKGPQDPIQWGGGGGRKKSNVPFTVAWRCIVPYHQSPSHSKALLRLGRWTGRWLGALHMRSSCKKVSWISFFPPQISLQIEPNQIQIRPVHGVQVGPALFRIGSSPSHQPL